MHWLSTSSSSVVVGSMSSFLFDSISVVKSSSSVLSSSSLFSALSPDPNSWSVICVLSFRELVGFEWCCLLEDDDDDDDDDEPPVNESSSSGP